MKYTLRVPTKEPYAYIETEFEGDANEAVAAYQELTRAVQGGMGLGMKAFAAILVEYVKTGGIVDGGNHDFSTNERTLLSEIKKLLKTNPARVRPDQERDKLDGD